MPARLLARLLGGEALMADAYAAPRRPVLGPRRRARPPEIPEEATAPAPRRRRAKVPEADVRLAAYLWPRVETKEKIADALGCDMSDLVAALAAAVSSEGIGEKEGDTR